MRRTIALAICSWVFAAAGQALPTAPIHPPKPTLFSRPNLSREGSAIQLGDQPDITKKLEKAFDSWQPGQKFQIPFANGVLKGTVKSIIHRNPVVTIIFLEVNNYKKAFMALTRKKTRQQTVFYGSVHHPDYSDALLLKKANNTYYFQPVPQSEAIID